MADTKPSAFPAVASVASTDQFVDIPSGGQASKATASQIRQYIGAGLSNASVASVSAGYAADTYLAGSAITIPVAGGWKAGTIYQCGWDMVKTAAGTAAMTVIIRMGTLGTTGDAAIQTLTWSAGTAAADTGWFELFVTFRTVGSGTSAVIAPVCICSHHLAATGLHQTGVSGTGILTPAASGGFNSTTQTIIGISINGGASFSGTNNLVQASALNI